MSEVKQARRLCRYHADAQAEDYGEDLDAVIVSTSNCVFCEDAFDGDDGRDFTEPYEP
jgi:hypothetical protein